MKSIVSMHVECIDAQVICCHMKRFENLSKGQEATITKYDNLIWVALKLAFYEPQQMLLIHTCRMMHVRVHLPHVVKVAVWNALLRLLLYLGVEHDMQVETLLEYLQSFVCKALDWARVRDFTQ